jgi:hypothetical protein
MGPDRANLIGQLWYNNFAEIGSDDFAAAAFQVAIWEIINEKSTIGDNLDLNVKSGYFQARDAKSNNKFENLANQWLGELDLSLKAPVAPGLIALTNDGYQDYIVQVHAVPGPSALVLGLVGALGFCVRASVQRRKRRAAAANLEKV